MTTMKGLFSDCNTTSEARRRYRALAKEHHPDLGGDPETMRIVAEQYAAFEPKDKSVLSDIELAARINNAGRPVSPVLFREFLRRPNLVEWWDENQGKHVISTREQYREYKSKPRPSNFERLFADAVARAD